MAVVVLCNPHHWVVATAVALIRTGPPLRRYRETLPPMGRCERKLLISTALRSFVMSHCTYTGRREMSNEICISIEGEQMRKLLEEALRRAESDLMAVGHDNESYARTRAMNDLKDWIERLESIVRPTWFK